MNMSVKYVEEYVVEMCDVCLEYKYGLFVQIHNSQICKECCQSCNKQLSIYELENE